MNIFKKNKTKFKAKRTFIKKGTCSRAFFYILNREFGHPREDEEEAMDQMAGGIIQQGYQCGLLWGIVAAVGAEAYRRSTNMGQTIASGIVATQNIMKSFEKRAGSIACSDFTKTNFNNKKHFAKYMLSGKFVSCFKLAGKWAPKAVQSAKEGLEMKSEYSQEPLSCASELIKQMNGTAEEMAMVSGFAGGMGLSGDACGVLAAVIWKRTLDRIRKDKDWTPAYPDPMANEILENFYTVTNYEMECHKICGRRFNSIDEHSEFIKGGGCQTLIETLAKSKNKTKILT